MLEPFGLAPVFRAPAALVDLDQRRIHDAVGQRLLRAAPRSDPMPGGIDFAAAGEMIEIFEDDARIVERLAVLQNERRILPSGFCCAAYRPGCWYRLRRSRSGPMRPRREAAILTLRPKGEAGDERSMSMRISCESTERNAFMDAEAPAGNRF